MSMGVGMLTVISELSWLSLSGTRGIEGRKGTYEVRDNVEQNKVGKPNLAIESTKEANHYTEPDI